MSKPIRRGLRPLAAVALALGAAAAAAQPLGATVDSLLAHARRSNPEFALMQREADAAATALEESARLAARSFELGEGELGAVLAARRLAIEGRLAATGQRRDAQYAAARLRLDAHRLWPLDVHPEDEGHMHH